MLPCVKAHAYGNDFLYVEQGLVRDLPSDALARAMCDRHEGIGADGLILYSKTPDGASIFFQDWGPRDPQAIVFHHIYKGFPHGMCTIHVDTINADLLAFVRG